MLKCRNSGSRYLSCVHRQDIPILAMSIETDTQLSIATGRPCIPVSYPYLEAVLQRNNIPTLSISRGTRYPICPYPETGRQTHLVHIERQSIPTLYISRCRAYSPYPYPDAGHTHLVHIHRKGIPTLSTSRCRAYAPCAYPEAGHTHLVNTQRHIQLCIHALTLSVSKGRTYLLTNTSGKSSVLKLSLSRESAYTISAL